jgi:hypothetical protein
MMSFLFGRFLNECLSPWDVAPLTDYGCAESLLSCTSTVTVEAVNLCSLGLLLLDIFWYYHLIHTLHQGASPGNTT